MKTTNIPYLILLLSLVLFSCKKNKNEETPANPPSGSAYDLTQNGDYSTLFYATLCDDIITETELTTLLSMHTERTNTTNTYCKYEFDNPGDTFSLFLKIENLSKNQVNEEIRVYDEDRGRLLKSTTGDSWIGINDSYGRMHIFNNNYTAVVYLSYGSPSAFTRITTAQRDQRMTLIKKVANELLRKHQR